MVLSTLASDLSVRRVHPSLNKEAYPEGRKRYGVHISVYVRVRGPEEDK